MVHVQCNVVDTGVSKYLWPTCADDMTYFIGTDTGYNHKLGFLQSISYSLFHIQGCIRNKIICGGQTDIVWPYQEFYLWCVINISKGGIFWNEKTSYKFLYNTFQIETYFCCYMCNIHSKNECFKLKLSVKYLEYASTHHSS